MWRHSTRTTIFRLLVDDFSIEYIDKDDAYHMLNALQDKCKITKDWHAKKYIDITLEWSYKKCYVYLSMPSE